jgi:hypothetical protein
MPLYLADVHLHRARLLGMRKSECGMRNDEGDREYPWGSAREDLAKARQLIDHHHYGRRRDELADAEAMLGHG